MGLEEPEVPHAGMQQTKQEGTFPFQVNVDGFLHVNGTSPKQKGTFSLQADVGANPEETAITAQLTAREGFTKLPISRQQRGTVSTEQSKQFDPGG